MLLQFISVGEGVVSKVHVALESKRELAIYKQSRGSWFVVEPMEYGFERVEAPIKGQHCLGGETVIMYRHVGCFFAGTWGSVAGEKRVQLGRL